MPNNLPVLLVGGLEGGDVIVAVVATAAIVVIAVVGGGIGGDPIASGRECCLGPARRQRQWQ
jgi:hypothetical protein